ncbi:MAG: SynChlorMet cassette protein ScmC [bacterium]
MNIYHIKLAGKNEWNILGNDDATQWVDNLASIMELKPSPLFNCPKLIFIRGSDFEDFNDIKRYICPDIPDNLPSDGWSVHHLRTIDLWFHPDVDDAVCKLGNKTSYEKEILMMWESSYLFHRQVQKKGGLPIHGALIERDGNGILLAAPGGTGKSTCCRRIPSEWHVLSDDEALVIPEENGGYVAHPFPTWSEHYWQRSEHTWKVENGVKLSAMFFLEQSKSDLAIPLGRGESAVFINQSSSQILNRSWINISKEEKNLLKRNLFIIASGLSSSIASFKLLVSLYGKFWEEIDKNLKTIK